MAACAEVKRSSGSQRCPCLPLGGALPLIASAAPHSPLLRHLLGPVGPGGRGAEKKIIGEGERGRLVVTGWGRSFGNRGRRNPSGEGEREGSRQTSEIPLHTPVINSRLFLFYYAAASRCFIFALRLRCSVFPQTLRAPPPPFYATFWHHVGA